MKIYVNNILAKIAPQGISFVIGVLISRKLGIEEYGKLAGYIIISQLVYFSLTSAFVTNYLREASISLAILDNTVLLILKIGFFLYFPFILFIAESENYVDKIIYTFFWITTIIMQLFNLYSAYLRKQGSDSSLVFVQTIPFLLLILLLILFIKKLTLLLISSFYIFSWVFSLLFLYGKKTIPLPSISNFKINSKTQLSIIFAAKVLILNTIFTQINANADQILLKSLIDAYTLGFYRISFVFSNLLMPVIGTFSFIYITQLKDVSNINQLNNKFNHYLKINFIIISIFVALIYFSSQYILYYIYKITNNIAIETLQILPLGLLFNALAQIVSYTLLLLKKDKIILMSLIISSIFNVALNIFYVPIYGAVGCAIISVITQVINFIFLFLYYRISKANDIFSINHFN